MNQLNEQDMSQGISGITGQTIPVTTQSNLNPPSFQKLQSNGLLGYLSNSNPYSPNSNFSGLSSIHGLRNPNFPLVNNQNQFSYTQQTSLSSGLVEPISIPSSSNISQLNKSQQIQQQTNYEDEHQSLPPLNNYYNTYYPYSHDLPPLTSYSTSSSLPTLSNNINNNQQMSPTTNYPYQNQTKPVLQTTNSFNSYLPNSSMTANYNQLSQYGQVFPNQYGQASSSELHSLPPRKSRKNSATVHNMTPETAARNRCTICQKQFKRPSSLQTHMYSHTGEKLFKCPWPECAKVFSVKSNMTRHYKLHLKDKRLSI